MCMGGQLIAQASRRHGEKSIRLGPCHKQNSIGVKTVNIIVFSCFDNGHHCNNLLLFLGANSSRGVTSTSSALVGGVLRHQQDTHTHTHNIHHQLTLLALTKFSKLENSTPLHFETKIVKYQFVYGACKEINDVSIGILKVLEQERETMAVMRMDFQNSENPTYPSVCVWECRGPRDWHVSIIIPAPNWNQESPITGTIPSHWINSGLSRAGVTGDDDDDNLKNGKRHAFRERYKFAAYLR